MGGKGFKVDGEPKLYHPRVIVDKRIKKEEFVKALRVRNGSLFDGLSEEETKKEVVSWFSRANRDKEWDVNWLLRVSGRVFICVGRVYVSMKCCRGNECEGIIKCYKCHVIYWVGSCGEKYLEESNTWAVWSRGTSCKTLQRKVIKTTV